MNVFGWISVVFLFTLRTVSAQTAQCELTASKENHGWIVTILFEGETVGHGALVSRNRALSAFTPFVEVAQDSSLLPTYEFIALDKKPGEDSCHQERKATKIIAPPDWPRLKSNQVVDIAFWEFDESFTVDADFPFLLPENDDVSKLSKATSETVTGDTCFIRWFSGEREKNTVWHQSEAKVTALQICKESFCKDDVCDLNGRYDICVFDLKTKKKTKSTDASQQQRVLLICHDELIGILGLVGKKASRGQTLFIKRLTVWETYKIHIKSLAVVVNTTITAGTLRETTAGTKEKIKPLAVRTTTAVESNTTSTTTTSDTSQPSTHDDVKTTGKPEFERQQRNEPTPARGKTLVPVQLVVALCAAASHKSR